MMLTERNKEIIIEFNILIKKRGLENKLEMVPIENTFKRRPHFYSSSNGEYHYFTVFLWQINKLAPLEATAEIKKRIDEAIQHFQLE